MSVHDRWWREVDGVKVKTAEYGQGRQWEVRWRNANRQQKRRFVAKGVAVKFDAQQKLDPETRVSTEGRRLTVDAMMETWLATKVGLLGLKTQDVYRTDKREVLLTFSGRLASSLKPSEVSVWAGRDRGQSLKERSLRALRQAYKIAMRDGLLKADPTEGVKKPPQVTPDLRFLSAAELGRLAAEAGNDPLIWLLGTVGLRLGEAVGLKVGDVRGTRIRVSRQVTTTSEGRRQGAPKQGKPRDVPVPPAVMAMLHLEERDPDEWLFPNKRGGVFDQHNWRQRVFRPAAERAGLGDLHPHLLRHTAASLAIHSGADAGLVQRMLGHKHASMTLDVYRHLFEDRLDDVALRMDEAIRDVLPKS